MIGSPRRSAWGVWKTCGKRVESARSVPPPSCSPPCGSPFGLTVNYNCNSRDVWTCAQLHGATANCELRWRGTTAREHGRARLEVDRVAPPAPDAPCFAPDCPQTGQLLRIGPEVDCEPLLVQGPSWREHREGMHPVQPSPVQLPLHRDAAVAARDLGAGALREQPGRPGHKARVEPELVSLSQALQRARVARSIPSRS